MSLKNLTSKPAETGMTAITGGAQAPGDVIVAGGSIVSEFAVPPAAATIGGALARPVSTGGSYRVARGSAEREHVVKPPAGRDPARDPEAARPRPPDTADT
jgi:hypothetical protein